MRKEVHAKLKRLQLLLVDSSQLNRKGWNAMKSKKAVGVVVIVSLGIAITWGVVSAGGDASEGRYRLEGTWIGTTPDGEIVRLTAIPLDPANQRVSLQISNVSADPNLNGLVEQVTGIPVTFASDYWGEAVRTGPQTFNFIAVRHAFNEDIITPKEPPDIGGNFEQVYILTSTGMIELTGPETMERDIWVSYYFPGQNPFGDPPFSCSGPSTIEMTRVPVIPVPSPCIPFTP